jgi:hypothetical protein
VPAEEDAMRRTVMFLVAVGMGCGSDALPPTTTAQVSAMGADITITTVSDPVLAGTELLLPASAVPANTSVTLSRGSDQAAPGESVVGPSLRLAPDGLRLAVPATLTLPYRASSLPAGTTVTVAVMSSGQRSELVPTEVGAATVTVEIQHFSDYQVVAAPPNCNPSTPVDLGPPGDGGSRQTGSDGGTGCSGAPADGGADGSPTPVDLAGPTDLSPPPDLAPRDAGTDQ